MNKKINIKLLVFLLVSISSSIMPMKKVTKRRYSKRKRKTREIVYPRSIDSFLEKNGCKRHPEKYKCQICTRSFQKSNDLEDHILFKHKNVCIMCPECNIKKAAHIVMWQHMKHEHGRKIDPLYICMRCKITYKKLENVKDHVATYHIIQQDINKMLRPRGLRFHEHLNFSAGIIDAIQNHPDIPQFIKYTDVATWAEPEFDLL